MESIVWKKVDEENHSLSINGVDMGVWSRSKMRHFIQQTDNAIEDYIPTSTIKEGVDNLNRFKWYPNAK